MSAITIASAANSSGRLGGNVVNALPISSCPSITSLIPTGGFPPTRAGRRRGRGCSTSSRRRRGRRSRRRARSPRTAATPLRHVAFGDDVVVAVQEHGRRAFWSWDLADDDRSGAGSSSGSTARRRRCGGGRRPVVRPEQRLVCLLGIPGRGHRRDRDELSELLPQLRHQRRHVRRSRGALRAHVEERRPLLLRHEHDVNKPRPERHHPVGMKRGLFRRLRGYVVR